MPLVKIECETSAESYQLFIYHQDRKLIATCPQDHPYEGELANGKYTVGWTIYGEPNTKYKIKFTGVSKPKKATERKIRDGEFVSINQRFFEVGGNDA